MNPVASFALLGILCVRPGFAQANQTDPQTPAQGQTLQAILTEVRAIHNEVRLSETTQLLLTELEIAQTAVNRATQRRDDLRSKVAQMQSDQKATAARLAHFPETPEPGTNPAEQKEAADMREEIKSSLDSLKSQGLERANDLQEAETSLRREQGTLDNIQTQLNDVVKKLEAR